MNSDAFLRRYRKNTEAMALLRLGAKTTCGWTLIDYKATSPWGWCLIKKGNAIARCSPATFLENVLLQRSSSNDRHAEANPS